MLKAQIETPMSKDNPTDVTVEEIPMPPIEKWGELDNSGGSAAATPARTAADQPERPREKLNFTGATPEVRIPLEYPFTHEEFGLVETVTVRRLTVGEVGLLIDARRANAPDNFDIYAAMTGLPAPVLRGLIDVDGEAVAGAAYDFLPRVFRPAGIPSGSSST